MAAEGTDFGRYRLVGLIASLGVLGAGVVDIRWSIDGAEGAFMDGTAAIERRLTQFSESTAKRLRQVDERLADLTAQSERHQETLGQFKQRLSAVERQRRDEELKRVIRVLVRERLDLERRADWDRAMEEWDRSD